MKYYETIIVNTSGKHVVSLRWAAGSIELFIVDQAFSPSYDLAPPTPSPLSLSKLDRGHTGRLRKTDNFMTGEGMGTGEEPNLRRRKSPVLH